MSKEAEGGCGLMYGYFNESGGLGAGWILVLPSGKRRWPDLGL